MKDYIPTLHIRCFNVFWRNRETAYWMKQIINIKQHMWMYLLVKKQLGPRDLFVVFK